LKKPRKPKPKVKAKVPLKSSARPTQPSVRRPSACEPAGFVALAPSWRAVAEGVRVLAASEDRQTLLLLLLPFLLLAAMLFALQTVRSPMYRLPALLAKSEDAVRQSDKPFAQITLDQPLELPIAPPTIPPPHAAPGAINFTDIAMPTRLPIFAFSVGSIRLQAIELSHTAPPELMTIEDKIGFAPLVLPVAPPATLTTPDSDIELTALSMPQAPPTFRTTAPGNIVLTALQLPARAPDMAELQMCVMNDETDGSRLRLRSRPALLAIGLSAGESFGQKLAEAARAQLNEVVIYNPRYAQIAYPMGDVAPMFGVCTDVVIRAYRELGIDLQELIQRTRFGSGDRSIDHRRTEILRKFLAVYGDNLAITEFAEDYKPGDIVTYYRPQNRASKSHIALVSDVIAPSGRPMILHNRGWGPQLEDALFVDKITGHYRFNGLKKATASASPPFEFAPGNAISRIDSRAGNAQPTDTPTRLSAKSKLALTPARSLTSAHSCTAEHAEVHTLLAPLCLPSRAHQRATTPVNSRIATR
jgi:uncharacterized protein